VCQHPTSPFYRLLVLLHPHKSGVVVVVVVACLVVITSLASHNRSTIKKVKQKRTASPKKTNKKIFGSLSVKCSSKQGSGRRISLQDIFFLCYFFLALSIPCVCVWKDHSNIDPDTLTHRVWEELIDPPPVKVSHHFPKCIQKRTKSSQELAGYKCARRVGVVRKAAVGVGRMGEGGQ
jgi:hypothetical protein